MGRWMVTLGAMVYQVGCAPTPSPLYLKTSPAGPDTRLTLMPASGLKLNARLKPVLELPDGRVLRFDSPQLTPDSAYFAGPPTTIAGGRQTSWHGKLRASVCDLAGRVCRTVVLDL
jgi:hypothetical protein